MKGTGRMELHLLQLFFVSSLVNASAWEVVTGFTWGNTYFEIRIFSLYINKQKAAHG
jgi:hypothetical protein